MSEPFQIPPGQPIIIERRERAGLFRRIVMPLLFLLLVLAFLGNVLMHDSALPTRLSERYVAGDLTASKVAIVEVSGLILDDEVEHVLKQIRQAREDDAVRAVILRIDSPGGTVTGADRIWRELMLLKGKKPLVASMGGMAASGGYYVAAPADYIFAEPTTMTGSIGVIMEIPKFGKLLDKIGVDFEVIKTGAWKDSPSIIEPMTPEERRRWQVILDESFRRFQRVIAQGRKLPLDRVEAVADGRVFTAGEALEHRLIDAEGYLDDAIRRAWNLARLESARVVRYARPPSLVDALFDLSSARADLNLSIDADALTRLQVPRILYLAR